MTSRAACRWDVVFIIIGKEVEVEFFFFFFLMPSIETTNAFNLRLSFDSRVDRPPTTHLTEDPQRHQRTTMTGKTEAFLTRPNKRRENGERFLLQKGQRRRRESERHFFSLGRGNERTIDKAALDEAANSKEINTGDRTPP